jgi:hypothetical protein
MDLRGARQTVLDAHTAAECAHDLDALIATHHGDDAVAEEAWVSGTHLGTYHGLPPTQRFVRVRVCGIYVFEEDRLVCERVYYDLLTVLRGLGLARDPDSVAGQIETMLGHPLHLGRTFGRDLRRRRAQRP